MDQNRNAFDATWKARLDRRLPDGCKLDLTSYPTSTEPITIAADPPEYADRVSRGSDICPICGLTTASDESRIGVTLNATLMIGAWAHRPCLEKCEVIGPTSNVPW